MKLSLSKQNRSKPSIEYSYEWFDLYLDSDLQELYQVFLRSNHYDKEAFFTDLSTHLLLFFEVSYDQIQHPAEHYTFSYVKGKATARLINGLEKVDLAPLFIKMIPVYQELHFNQVKKRIKEGRKTGSLNTIKIKARNLLENVFNRLINTSALLLESIVIGNDIYRYANPKKVLFEIIKESIKKENFSIQTFTLTHGSPEHFIDKVHGIAIKHTVFVLDRLPDEEKVALIPTLKRYLHNEQNYKVVKGIEYKRIDASEEFYKLFLDRFIKIEKEMLYNKKEEKSKEYFVVGLKTDSKEEIETKTLKLKNFLHRIKNRFENDPNHLKSIFKPWVDEYKYKDNLYFIGDFKELARIIGFLISKEIIRQVNIKVLKNRVLINGKEKITKTDDNISVSISNAKKETNSVWYKDLNGYL